MHQIEPYYNWKLLYDSSNDPYSPFFEKEYSEFEFTDSIYDHYIHPQWDNMGSSTLFIKIIYANYEDGFAVIELIGEWNDLLYNDIMTLKREIVEQMIKHGIHKFILIGENVLNFHSSDDCYYEEWSEEIADSDGWIALLNFRDYVLDDMAKANIDSYIVLGGKLNELSWRTMNPEQLYELVESQVMRRLQA
ncbi:MAG: hypothetical protein SGI87_11360 [Flavobacteriales bacterium]|nr:hypothetical protein [Flavobacteriales bacterium]